MSERWPQLIIAPEPRKANYTYVNYGTARGIFELPAGPVEIFAVKSPTEFATDRVITQAEYEQIRDFLQEITDCALLSSSPEDRARFLARSDK